MDEVRIIYNSIDKWIYFAQIQLIDGRIKSRTARTG